MSKHAKPRDDSLAEVYTIPTPLMNDWLETEQSERRSRDEQYGAKLLMTLQLCPNPVINEIFDIHYPDEHAGCISCSKIAEFEHEHWPCLTARVLGKVLGVNEPDGYGDYEDTWEYSQFPNDDFDDVS